MTHTQQITSDQLRQTTSSSSSLPGCHGAVIGSFTEKSDRKFKRCFLGRDDNRSSELTNILVGKEKPVCEDFVVGNILRDDNHHEIRISCNAVEICHPPVLPRLPLKGLKPWPENSKKNLA
jgi:hypothetical protein